MDSSKLPITGPCPIDLDAIGYDRGSKVSHCSHCSKNVHNLSTMTESAARAFLREHAGETLCVTYARDKNGVVQFQPDPQVVPLTALLRRPAAAAAGLGLAAALAACTPHGDQEHVVGEAPVVDPIEIPAGGMVAPDLDEKEPCNKPDTEPLEMVEGEMPIEKVEKAPPPPLAGAIEVPEPEQMYDGELAVPHEPKPVDANAQVLGGQMKAP